MNGARLFAWTPMATLGDTQVLGLDDDFDNNHDDVVVALLVLQALGKRGKREHVLERYPVAMGESSIGRTAERHIYINHVNVSLRRTRATHTNMCVTSTVCSWPSCPCFAVHCPVSPVSPP